MKHIGACTRREGDKKALGPSAFNYAGAVVAEGLEDGVHDAGPIALRYPRGEGTGLEIPARGTVLPIGKGRVLRQGSTIAILSLGTRLEEALKAADILEARGLSATVADLRFAKPLDEDLIRRLLTSHEVAVTVEEAAIGGLGAHVLTMASDHGLIDAGL